ncbi:hypothetical protein V8D89_000943, partial [Ganoderma adspersum]
MLAEVGCRDNASTLDNSTPSSSSPSPSSQRATSPANEPTASTSDPIDGASPAPLPASSTGNTRAAAPLTIHRRPTFTPPSFAPPHRTALHSGSLSDFTGPANTGSLIATATPRDSTTLPSSLVEPNSTFSSPTGIPTSTPPPNPSQVHLGKEAVVGIVVAICVAAIVLVLAMFLCTRRRCGHRRRASSAHTDEFGGDGDEDGLGTVEGVQRQPHPCASSPWSWAENGSLTVMPEKLLQEQSSTRHDVDLTSVVGSGTAPNGRMDSDATFDVSWSAYSGDEVVLQMATRWEIDGGVRLAGGRPESGVQDDFDYADMSESDTSTLPPPYAAHFEQT